MAQIASKPPVRRLIERGADSASRGQHVASASAPRIRAEYDQAMSFALSFLRGQPGRACPGGALVDRLAVNHPITDTIPGHRNDLGNCGAPEHTEISAVTKAGRWVQRTRRGRD